MIDTLTESVLTFAQAADELSRRRRGRKAHVSTLNRWATAGCEGVVLETIQIGARADSAGTAELSSGNRPRSGGCSRDRGMES